VADDASLKDESVMVADINSLRAARGLSALTTDSRLTAIGRWWARQMAASGSLAHNPALAGQVPPEWQSLGENVGEGPVIGDIFTAFRNSPEHLQNMVNPLFNAVGVGVTQVGTVWTSVEFMQVPPGSIVTDGTSGPDWYRLAAAGGDVVSFGTAPGVLWTPVAGDGVQAIASTAQGGGYWLASADGSVSAFGDARAFASTNPAHLNQPIVGMAATPSGGGYWLVAKDGGIFAFGDAPFLGSTGATHVNQPIVGMAGTPSGGGYWLVAKDGGIFAFGDAPFLGSLAGHPVTRPVVGLVGGA
jgi:hypothetical protein